MLFFNIGSYTAFNRASESFGKITEELAGKYHTSVDELEEELTNNFREGIKIKDESIALRDESIALRDESIALRDEIIETQQAVIEDYELRLESYQAQNIYSLDSPGLDPNPYFPSQLPNLEYIETMNLPPMTRTDAIMARSRLSRMCQAIDARFERAEKNATE